MALETSCAAVTVPVVAPADTPPDVIEKLHAAFKAVGKQPAIQEKLVGIGLIPVDTPSVPELRKFLGAEMVRWLSSASRTGGVRRLLSFPLR